MPLTADDVRRFVRTNHNAVLATRRSDGGAQLSPVSVGVDDDGSLIISTRETAVKTGNVRRHPYAELCLLNDGFYGEWLQAEGSVTVEPLPEAMDGLVRYYRGIRGEHPDWDDYRAAMARERRVLLRLSIERVGPTRSG
jgi:PPOX class probable F420-dependent enzyme